MPATTNTTTGNVPDVVEHLQDLLLTLDAADEKKIEQEDHIHATLTGVLDWSQNAYRRQELTDCQASTKVLVPALLQRSQPISVLLLLLEILSHLAAASATQREEIHAAGGVTVVGDLVASVGNSTPRLTAAAYKLLGHLALSKACALTITTDVLPHTILQSLQDPKTHIRVVREAVGILSNLAGHAKTQTPLLQRNTSNAIMDALCQVMQRHADDATVQHEACQVWWNLLAAAPQQQRRSQKDPLPPVIQVWQDLNGMTYILQALENHATRAAVQEAACGALSCVSWRPKGADDDARAEATSHVLQTLKNHANQPTTLTTACRALANLCRDCHSATCLVLEPSKASKDTTPLAHLQAIAKTACQGDGDQVRLALAVLDAWSALAVNAKYAACTTLVQAHVVEGVVQCMTAYPDQAVVQDAGSLVLWAIAQHYGKYVAAAEGCCEAIEAAMETLGEQVRYGERLQGRLQWKQRWGRR